MAEVRYPIYRISGKAGLSGYFVDLALQSTNYFFCFFNLGGNFRLLGYACYFFGTLAGGGFFKLFGCVPFKFECMGH